MLYRRQAHLKVSLNKHKRVTLLISLFCCLTITLLMPAQIAKAQRIEMQGKRPRVGLALGGGGTRGLAHIGVLRVLKAEGIPIDCIAGTSVGAIVGGLYAAGFTPDRIEQVFQSKSFHRAYYTVPLAIRLAAIPIFLVPHLFGHHHYDGLYKGNKFAAYINDIVPDTYRNLEDLPIPFCAVASNLLDGKSCMITKGNIGRALQSSSAIPALRRPFFWEGKLLVDGGVLTNLPCDQALSLGADIVIAVNVDEQLVTLQPEYFQKIGSVSYRCITMHLVKLDEPETRKADIVIHPNVTGIQLLSRKLADVKSAIAAGENAARQAVPLILKKINEKTYKLSNSLP